MCNVVAIVCQCLLVARPHVCCCAAPHVFDALLCPGFRLWTCGLWPMALQGVSVQWCACQRSTRSFCTVWGSACQCLLAPRPHVWSCVAPHVAQRLCCCALTFVVHYPFLNGLAASECSGPYMATADSCFAYCVAIVCQ